METAEVKNILGDLRDLVVPYEVDKPYFRPFVCDGKQSGYDAFLVGINPATPIYERDIDIDRYVYLLTHYDEFYEEYQRLRERDGKTKLSRTRVGTINFVRAIREATSATILETNIIPYPTSNIKELKYVHADIILKAKELFLMTLMEYLPKVIIVHSKTSLLQLLEVLSKKEMVSTEDLDLGQSIRTIERKGHFAEITYPNGSKSSIFACRHFMYYRTEGKSFSDFREAVVSCFKRV